MESNEHLDDALDGIETWCKNVIVNHIERLEREIQVEKLSGQAVVAMFENYKFKMEAYFGRGRCFEAEQQEYN